ncbi:hypothetical protein COLO4_01893 [Corchorus olitorius]|uniref:Uncharacterized protein n=1 Tax=Corchorus olitorius TaxID=93759 RepID=A0A1R3L1Z3_9ROSI|nr:hypothetical protein COLO4_01893 [Corchorus olitorius]
MRPNRPSIRVCSSVFIGLPHGLAGHRTWQRWGARPKDSITARVKLFSASDRSGLKLGPCFYCLAMLTDESAERSARLPVLLPPPPGQHHSAMPAAGGARSPLHPAAVPPAGRAGLAGLRHADQPVVLSAVQRGADPIPGHPQQRPGDSQARPVRPRRAAVAATGPADHDQLAADHGRPGAAGVPGRVDHDQPGVRRVPAGAAWPAGGAVDA